MTVIKNKEIQKSHLARGFQLAMGLRSGASFEERLPADLGKRYGALIDLRNAAFNRMTHDNWNQVSASGYQIIANCPPPGLHLEARRRCGKPHWCPFCWVNDNVAAAYWAIKSLEAGGSVTKTIRDQFDLVLVTRIVQRPATDFHLSTLSTQLIRKFPSEPHWGVLNVNSVYPSSGMWCAKQQFLFIWKKNQPLPELRRLAIEREFPNEKLPGDMIEESRQALPLESIEAAYWSAIIGHYPRALLKEDPKQVTRLLNEFRSTRMRRASGVFAPKDVKKRLGGQLEMIG